VASQRYDTIVIGAGMSGLAAGIRLAMFDKRVLVLERHALWGGLNSFYTKAGRPFDVGLHALTNWAPRRAKGSPLTKLLRQLRIKHEELRLGEQRRSEVVLGDLRLGFTNDFAHFEAEVARAFPHEIDRFRRLVATVRSHPLREQEGVQVSARAVLADHLRDPALLEALMLPVCFYGSAKEDDCDWNQFVVLFSAILLEGLARPEGGIRTMLNLLIKRLKRLGAELRTRAGVARIVTDAGRVRGVVLDDGTELEADTVLSSAGWVQTAALVDDPAIGASVTPEDVGRVAFLESISVLEGYAADLGIDVATSFYSLEDRLRYRCPQGGVDPASGVLSVPENFASEKPLPEGMVRITVLANHDHWRRLKDRGDGSYEEAKLQAADDAISAVTKVYPDWRPRTVFRDVFTPTTVVDYTGHANGAIYGSPRKRLSGQTGVEGLVLIGTDQGYLGVTGAMLSGIAMANHHALAPSV